LGNLGEIVILSGVSLGLKEIVILRGVALGLIRIVILSGISSFAKRSANEVEGPRVSWQSAKAMQGILAEQQQGEFPDA